MHCVSLTCLRCCGCRYALDVNVERAEDVLTHKRLLQLAEDPANRPAFDVRPVQVNMFAFTRLSFFAFFFNE